MGASLSVRLLPETVRELASGSISAAYAGLGTAMSRPIRMMVLQNLTDETVWISFDGVNDHMPLAALGYIILDITANKTREDGFFLSEGQRLYVKRLGTPTSGSVYLTTFFGAN